MVVASAALVAEAWTSGWEGPIPTLSAATSPDWNGQTGRFAWRTKRPRIGLIFVNKEIRESSMYIQLVKSSNCAAFSHGAKIHPRAIRRDVCASLLLMVLFVLAIQALGARDAKAQDATGQPVAQSAPSSRISVDWPPTLDARNTVTRSLDGRTIQRFVHGCPRQWGYPPGADGEWNYPPAQETGPKQQNRNSFYLVAPKNPRENAPLLVVLHSANRTAFDYLGFQCLNRPLEGIADPDNAVTNGPDDVYALYLNSTNSEWWGASQLRRKPPGEITPPAPAELRVLDTIEWVVNQYKIDRNRIYLTGVSMGGCGALGIGMPHGDIFAAMRVTVPAGTGYASYRMGGFAPAPAGDAPQSERDAWIKRASGIGLPDPPVIVDFSSQMDVWATTQPALVQAAQAGRLPLVLSWGMFGHPTSKSLIDKYPFCEVTLQYPWLDIRKNQAYPVFTHASSDQRCPWLNAPAEYDESGQINALLRWKSIRDASDVFAMELWIAHPKLAKNAPPPMPEKATADVTPRRLQRFKIQSGQRYAWELRRDGQAVASGQASADAMSLLTIPNVALSTSPATLTLTKAGN